MSRTVLRLIPILVILSVAFAALPAAAQTDPAPAPKPGETERFACLPTGLALAVISQDGVVADVLPAEKPEPAADAAGDRVIVLPGPGVAGACAEFSGFWGPGAGGTEAVELTLVPRDLTRPVAEPVARDGFKDERRGPSMHQQRVKALTRFEKPGRYPFMAVLRVHASRLAPTAADAAGVEDALRVPFVVQVLGSPEPRPAGAIEGFVFAAEQPLAGAVVAALPLERPRPFSPPGDTLPIIEPRPNADQAVVVDGDDASVGAGKAVTDEKGHYRLEVPVGKYLVVAVARGYAQQYFKMKSDPKNADPVEVRRGETSSGIDFRLKKAEEPKPPERPVGVIRGKVVGQGSGPLAGAKVVAQPTSTEKDPGKPLYGEGEKPSPEGPALVAVTDAEGSYELRVPLGSYLVAAGADGFARQWYKGADAPDGAKAISLTRDDPEESNVNFELKKAEAPKPPAATAIGGSVFAPDASGERKPIPGALVIVAKRAHSTDPSVAPRFEIVAKGQTDRQGAYLIPVKPGEYVVGVVLSRADALKDWKIVWYQQTRELAKATTVKAVEGAVTGGIDFEVPLTTSP